MPLVQAVVPESEYDLLRQRARKEGKPMKAVIREALRAHLVPDTIDPEDPIFRAFPIQTKKGRTHWDSRDHDELLYPSRP
ncbi:MAG: ribbon-helix-helix protein, CopG family [Thermoplasmata archaeon]